ncbi:unnamed protein product, partial [Amoebophrya sp. A25]|eukprot:GSA25T00012133001.1
MAERGNNKTGSVSPADTSTRSAKHLQGGAGSGDYGAFLCQIDRSLAPHINENGNIATQEARAKKVLERLTSLIEEAKSSGGLPAGEILVFGSFSNGFKTGGSDLDIVYTSDDIGNNGSKTTIQVLNAVMNLAEKYEFLPILKFTAKESNVEVDFCINNRLGARNSLLLQQYSAIDKRVQDVGRLVKAWVKRKELVGTADGFLNSYAYMLLVIYFLQVGLEDPLLPNLQRMATEPHLVQDGKWGRDDRWDTKFFSEKEQGPLTAERCRELTGGKFHLGQNKMSLAELLFTFFHFYTRIFDWKTEAVVIRLADPITKNAGQTERGGPAWDRQRNEKKDVMESTSKITGQSMPALNSEAAANLWYIEDPFDLRHNLAGKMTANGKKRMLQQMERTMRELAQTGNWDLVVPADDLMICYFLKCRISQSVGPDLFIRELAPFGVTRIHMPKDFKKNRYGMAFLEFANSTDRRRCHTKNESYLADCQLQIHYSSRWALEDAVAQQQYVHYDIRAYITSSGQGGQLEAEPGKMPAAPKHLRAGLLARDQEKRAVAAMRRMNPNGTQGAASASYPSLFSGGMPGAGPPSALMQGAGTQLLPAPGLVDPDTTTDVHRKLMAQAQQQQSQPWAYAHMMNQQHQQHQALQAQAAARNALQQHSGAAYPPPGAFLNKKGAAARPKMTVPFQLVDGENRHEPLESYRVPMLYQHPSDGNGLPRGVPGPPGLTPSHAGSYAAPLGSSAAALGAAPAARMRASSSTASAASAGTTPPAPGTISRASIGGKHGAGAAASVPVSGASLGATTSTSSSAPSSTAANGLASSPLVRTIGSAAELAGIGRQSAAAGAG